MFQSFTLNSYINMGLSNILKINDFIFSNSLVQFIAIFWPPDRYIFHEIGIYYKWMQMDA